MTHTHTHHAGPCRVSCVPIARPSWRHLTVCAKGKMSEITRSTIQCVALKRKSWIHDTLSDAAVGGGGSLCCDNRRRTKASAAWLMVSSPRPQAVTEQPAVRWRSWSTWQIELAKVFFLHNKKPLLTNNKKNNNKSPSLCPSLSYSLAFEMHFPISYLLRQMMLSEVRWGVIISTQSGPIHWYLKWFANMASPHYIVITGGSNYCPRACTWQMQGSILSFLYSRFHTDMT